MNEEMVISTRTFDLLSWLLPATNSFPRAHRNTFTRRLLDAAFDLEERLGEANRRKARARIERLERADEALDRVRIYLRLDSHMRNVLQNYANISFSLREKVRMRGINSGVFIDFDPLTPTLSRWARE